ncbi:MAG: hypothetical protein KC550_00165 [Nanoarchaeota archaeon]|nr:hypothetical protein [Nanoarchaeota archaeon]
MVELEKAKKEVKQVKIFVLIIALIQAALLFFAIKVILDGTVVEPSYLNLAMVGAALVMNIITFVGLNKEQKYGIQLGFVTGAIMLISGAIQMNIIGIIISLIWLWSFYRIKDVF